MSRATRRLNAAIDGGAMSNRRFSGSAGIGISGAMRFMSRPNSGETFSCSPITRATALSKRIPELRGQRAPQCHDLQGPVARRASRFQRRDEDATLLGAWVSTTACSVRRSAVNSSPMMAENCRSMLFCRSLDVAERTSLRTSVSRSRDRALIGSPSRCRGNFRPGRLELRVGGFGGGICHLAKPAGDLHLRLRRLAGAHVVAHCPIHCGKPRGGKEGAAKPLTRSRVAAAPPASDLAVAEADLREEYAGRRRCARRLKPSSSFLSAQLAHAALPAMTGMRAPGSWPATFMST